MGTATTPWPEAPERRRCGAATGTTRSTGTAATTWRSWAPATTRSSGIRATGATRSKVRTVPTPVHDLGGTDLTAVNNDLAAALGGSTGDSRPDQTIVEGTNGDDAIRVAGDSTGVSVTGLAARVHIAHAEPANDALAINALAGDDVIEASGLASNVIALTLDGGAGDDVLIGSAGNDILFGRDGDDVLLGGPGQDVVDGGAGDNILIQD